MPGPSTQMWNRLEPRPRTNSFNRSLRAEVRDALWMLTRQWQLGEWNGEDTGSAAFARLDMQTTRINRIASETNAAVPIDDNIPMECTVEREHPEPDLMLRITLGRQFLKMLRAHLAAIPLTPGDISTIEQNDVRTTAALMFVPPGPPPLNTPEFFSNPELWQATLALGNGRAIDGWVLLSSLKLGNPVTTTITFANAPTGTLASVNAAANAAGIDFLNWYNEVYSEPSTTSGYWHQKHMEYQFACSAPTSATGYTVFTADEYYQGHLDWYSFDIQATPIPTSLQSLVSGSPDTSLIVSDPMPVIPARIAFGGMPAPRFWEMEDGRVDFGGMNVSTTDTAHLLVGEFATIYSNDWTVLPYVVPTGSICNLRGILVTDVFGQNTIVNAAGASDWQSWNMYTLTVSDNSRGDQRLFVPPVVANMLESAPVESVNFMRDEMANMAWGVETIVPDGVDGGEKGVEAARRLVSFIEGLAGTPTIPASPNIAEIKYNVMNSVPENWIPFIPVRLNGPASQSIQLQRAAMPRQIGTLAPTRIRPRTSLLRDGYNPSTNTWSASYIFEEEIPRSGAILTRTWQRARWHDGRIALWLGRRKQNGRGEGNSGLRFDYLTAK